MVEAFGPLSAQMLVHIVAMNAVAPLLATAALRSVSRTSRPRFLLPATLLQALLLWAWHAPPAVDAAMRSHLWHGIMQASLFAAALLFWLAVFVCHEARWRAILSLLVTGKLFCLLGVLLVFAPRALYPGIAGGASGAALADQQLAGLFMLVACPATYLVVGVVLAARWLGRIEADGAASDSRNARQAA